MLCAGRKQRGGRPTWRLQGEDVTQVRHLARRSVRIAAVLLGVGAAVLATGLVVGLLLVGAAKLVATYLDALPLDALPLAAICAVVSAILVVTSRSIRALVTIVAYLDGEFQMFAIR